jgi:hypothetical protein
MAIDEERGNESLDIPLSEESIRKAAADYPVTFDQVCEVLNEIQEVLSNEIRGRLVDSSCIATCEIINYRYRFRAPPCMSKLSA